MPYKDKEKQRAASRVASRRYRQRHLEQRKHASREWWRRLRAERPEKEAEYNRQNYLRHREQRLTYQRAYYAKIAADPELFAALNKRKREYHNQRVSADEEYRELKRINGRKTDAKRGQKRNEANAKRRRDNPEYAAKESRRAVQWAKRNPDSVRARNARRKARIKNAPGQYTQTQFKSILRAQGFRCYWCKAGISRKCHGDHFIPVARGGTNWPENIVASCGRCNDSKLHSLRWIIRWAGHKEPTHHSDIHK